MHIMYRQSCRLQTSKVRPNLRQMLQTQKRTADFSLFPYTQPVSNIVSSVSMTSLQFVRSDYQSEMRSYHDLSGMIIGDA